MQLRLQPPRRLAEDVVEVHQSIREVHQGPVIEEPRAQSRQVRLHAGRWSARPNDRCRFVQARRECIAAFDVPLEVNDQRDVAGGQLTQTDRGG